MIKIFVLKKLEKYLIEYIENINKL